MGQISSSDHLSSVVSAVQDELKLCSKQLYASALCSYEEFCNQINELNALCSKATSLSGKRLLFVIKKGTDSTVLWKATVRIAVLQVDGTTGKVLTCRFLTLPQFLRVFNTVQDQLLATLPSSCSTSDEEYEASGQLGNVKSELTFSRLFSNVNEIAADNADKLNECCICLERKPDVMLPCAHTYCQPCIEQWNSANKTCPICREALNTTDDAWVIQDIPGAEDVSREIYNSLIDFATEQSESATNL